MSLNSRTDVLLNWFRLVSITGLSQVSIQAIGFVSGILIIRFLPPSEYALYTLTNTMLATMLVLADSGIAAGVMAQGGKNWQDRQHLGMVLQTGLTLRKQFSAGSLLVAVPILLYFLLHHEAGWLEAVLICLSLIPAFWANLTGELLEISLKLQQQVVPLQRAQVIGNAGRLLMTGLGVMLLPWTALVVLVNGITQVFINRRIRILSGEHTDFDQTADPLVRRQILGVVKRHMPSAIYYCFSGQLTIWLVSAFGSTMAVAQIGALSRLSMVLNLFTILFSMLIVPRFARLPDVTRLLFNRFWLIQLGWLGLLSGLVGFVWLFAPYILMVLGPAYTSLRSEAVLLLAGSCLNLMAGSTFALYMSRGWVVNPAVAIGANLAGLVAGISLIDVSTLSGVLIFNLFVAATQVIVNNVYAVLAIRSVGRAAMADSMV